METVELDSAVVGAGVVGLAIGAELARRGDRVAVLEAERWIGGHTSSRNSEVVHAGLYYPPGSLKALHCVRGRQRLYDYCAERGVPARACGKLIVATTPGEIATLEMLAVRGDANGVPGLSLLDKAAVAAYEPAVQAEAALWSPETGIVDSHALLQALHRDLAEYGGHLALATRCWRIAVEAAGYSLTCQGPDGEFGVSVRRLVNAGGPFAWDLARLCDDLESRRIPLKWLAKGQYFALSGAAPFRHLVYPVPQAGGLGIHATLDMAGTCRFGPDVTWVESLDYSVDAGCEESFRAAVARYYPGIAGRSLTPAYAGVRPRVSGPDDPPGDFSIVSPPNIGDRAAVHLFGIDSPGLTAALSLAETVADRLDGPEDGPEDGPVPLHGAG